jgi:hypothetical protein
MRAKAVRVKEFDIVGGLDLTHGEYVIRVFFNKSLIDCFKGSSELEDRVLFERAGFRMFQEEPSEQKQETKDGRSDASDSSSAASRV